jgi:hypothetical protein
MNVDPPPEVRAVVRANPMSIELTALGPATRKCGAVPMHVRLKNMGAYPVLVADIVLKFDEDAFHTAGNGSIGSTVLKHGHEKPATFVLLPRESGNFVVVAKAEGIISSEHISVESTAVVVRIEGCPATSKGRH